MTAIDTFFTRAYALTANRLPALNLWCSWLARLMPFLWLSNRTSFRGKRLLCVLMGHFPGKSGNWYTKFVHRRGNLRGRWFQCRKVRNETFGVLQVWDSSSILQIDGKICKKVHLPRQKLPGETAHRKRRKGGIQRVIVLPEGWSLEILLSYPLVWKLVGEIKKMSPIANIVRSQVLLLDNHCSILILPRPTSRNSTLSYQRFFKRRMLTW